MPEGDEPDPRQRRTPLGAWAAPVQDGSEELPMRRLWRSKAGKFGIALVVVVVLAVTAGPFIYINFIRDDAPDRLSFSDVPAAADSSDGSGASTTSAPSAGAAASTSDVTGTWAVTTGSQVGYRVQEILFGQNAEGVGRTSDVTGTMTIDGTTVTDASFEADLTTVASDESRRDSQFQGRIMDTDNFPTATFELSEPITLESIPDNLVETSTTATGDLTLRGTTKPVTIDLVARRNGQSIEITGSLTIVFDEWGIPNPSNAAVSTEDHGELELLLVLTK
jgi:polyisoprenoid-binding protein YceI